MDKKLVIGSMSMEPQIRLICRYEYQEFFKYPNVVGVGLADKVINNNKTDIKCICVFVEKKIYELPEEFKVPEFYKGIPTDIIESGKIYGGGYKGERGQRINSKAGIRGFTALERPFRPGYSIGAPDYTKVTLEGSSGTGCCLVVAEYKGKRVLCLLGTASVISDNNKRQPGDDMIQPSPTLGGTYKDVFGYAAYWSPINFIEGQVNYADTGLVKLTDGPNSLTSNDHIMRPEIAFMTKPRGTALPNLNEKIQLSGASAGYRAGTVTAVDVTARVTFEGGVAVFVKQIHADFGILRDDDGAPLVNMDNYIIGITIASGTGFSIASPIDAALALVNAELLL